MYPCSDEILDWLRTQTAKVLNVDCGFAQKTRLLVNRGVERSYLVGMNHQDLFVYLGFDLFQDKSTLKARFVTADI